MLIALLAKSASEDGASPAFPPFEPWHMPSQLFWLAILFTTLYIALSRFILPKLGDTLEKRSDRLASDLDQAARLNDQAVEAQQALDLRVAQARSKARETNDKARAQGEAEMATELAKVDAQIEKKLAAADERISTLRTTAMKNVESIAVEATEAMTSRLGIKTTPEDVKKAVSAVME